MDAHLKTPEFWAPPAFDATLQIYSNLLFTTYLLPVEIIGFLLLIAMLGVIALSQRAPAPKPPNPAAQ